MQDVLGINLQLLRVDRPTQTRVILPGVLAVRVPLGIVDVLGREVAAQSLGRDLELLRHISVSEEAADNQLQAIWQPSLSAEADSQDHDNVYDGLQVGLAQTSDINCLDVSL